MKNVPAGSGSRDDTNSCLLAIYWKPRDSRLEILKIVEHT